MGGKRRFASGILAAMGVRHEDITSATLVDAGTWGIVWPVILHRGHEVADVLDGWRGEDPVALWDRLVKQPWPADPVQAAAHWLWIQGRAASGVPIWWAGVDWQKGLHPGQSTPQRASQRGRWLQGDRSKSGIRTVSQKGTARGGVGGLTDPGTIADRCRNLAWRMGAKPGGRPQKVQQRGTGAGQNVGLQSPAVVAERCRVLAGEPGWRMGTKPDGEEQVAGQTGRQKGVTRPGVVAERCRSIAEGWRMGARYLGEDREPGQAGYAGGVQKPMTVARGVRSLVGLQAMEVHHIDVRAFDPPEDASDCAVYFDPPYEGRTGYSVGLPREQVLEVAARWADAGALVAVSEAVPLDLPGWSHVEITSLGRAGCGPEWLTMNREPLWKPAEQLTLLGAM